MPTRRQLDRQILALALPAVVALATDPLYDLTDTAILGHLGTHQLGGAALATVLLELGYAVFIFLMFGTTASVARLIGAGRHADATHRGVQGLWLGAGLGIVSAGIMWLAGPSLISLFGGRGPVAADALTYFRISLAGFPAFMIVMAGTGYVRGTQDTRTPLAIAVSSVTLNLALELTLIYGFGFGVGASALGTVVAKWVAATVYAALVVRAARRHRLPLRPEQAALRELSAAGWPLFVRTAALRLAFTASTAAASRLGTAQLAAYAVGFEVWSLLAYLADGLEVAGQALVARALGAGDADGARATGRRILRLALMAGAGSAVVVLAAHGVVPSLFTRSPQVRSLAATGLLWVAVMQPINLVTFSLDGILVGAGDLRYLAVAMVGALALFAPLAWWIAASGAGLWLLWAALTWFMACRAGALGLRFARGRWVTVGAPA